MLVLEIIIPEKKGYGKSII